MLSVCRYSAEKKAEWDAFARTAKNAHFFFQRDYLEYHADRFVDHSLLFFQDHKLTALLPANVSGDKLVSHGGLTFGGFLVDASMTTRRMLELFAELMRYLRANGLTQLIYKCIPHIYHTLPAEEDRYALFLHGAHLSRRDMTSTIEIQAKLPFQERRRRGAKKAKSAGVCCRASEDLQAFWPLLEQNLRQSHETRPAHSLAEIELLHRRFPDNIKLFGAYLDEQLLAGVLVYENAPVAHAQYISASEEGKRLGALDALFAWLITEVYNEKPRFDFGISTEDNGRLLNEGLIDQKEGFGARGVVHDHYQLEVAAESTVAEAS
ncbi:MAG TPA: GNAT family N-acetyltransferase [Gemmataceae bacterium]|jgi:hypothetical protein